MKAKYILCILSLLCLGNGSIRSAETKIRPLEWSQLLLIIKKNGAPYPGTEGPFFSVCWNAICIDLSAADELLGLENLYVGIRLGIMMYASKTSLAQKKTDELEKFLKMFVKTTLEVLRGSDRYLLPRLQVYLPDIWEMLSNTMLDEPSVSLKSKVLLIYLLVEMNKYQDIYKEHVEYLCLGHCIDPTKIDSVIEYYDPDRFIRTSITVMEKSYVKSGVLDLDGKLSFLEGLVDPCSFGSLTHEEAVL